MHYKKSNDSFPYGNRFETTYSSSYNKSFNYISKPNVLKISENNTNDFKNKYDYNVNSSTPKTINKSNADSNSKFLTPVISSTPLIISKDTNSQSYQPKLDGFKQYSYNHMVTQIARITDSLYLSSLNAITADRLKDIGITLVVSLIAENSSMRLPASIERMQINIEDTENVNIRRHFEKVLERINIEERRQGRVLVHCVAGISRSSTIVLAYLMRYNNMRLREAYNLVRAERPYIQPNLGFWRQLIDYEKSIFGTSTVNMVPMDGSRILIPDVAPSILPEILSATPMMRIQPRSPLSVFPVRSTYF